MHTSESAPNLPLHEPAAATPTAELTETHLGQGDRPELESQRQYGKTPSVTVTQPAVNPSTLQLSSWWHTVQQHSRLLLAVVEPMTGRLLAANDHFCKLVAIDPADGIAPASHGVASNLGQTLQRLLSEADYRAIQRLYRRHVLHRVLQTYYQIDPTACRLLDEPVMVSFAASQQSAARYVECWLRSDQLHITRRNPQLDEFAALELQQLSPLSLAAALTDPARFEQWEQQLQLDNYQIEGAVLLEGVDITDREIVRRISQRLIDRDAILQPQKFAVVDQLMRSLFRAQNTLILSIEAAQTRLFIGSIHTDLDATTYSLDSLQGSHFLEAVNTNRVLIVSDLAADCRTEGGKKLLALGIRSFLLMPLVSYLGNQATAGADTSIATTTPVGPTLPTLDTPHTVGVVALLSDRPQHFDALDYRHAQELIPAFTAALTAAQRQLVQQRFITNIHPAVEWRFLQEAERRSLGLPAEPIVFADVYPLYGISDIRGSSEERNRAIQADLLAQFGLGLAVVDAACQTQTNALTEQVRLDLRDQIRQIQAGITVDAEVAAIQYLQDNLEIYFDHFAQCGEAAATAITVYREACDNPYQCVYQARAKYDRLIEDINARLRETWDRCQHSMQAITPHYCDIETTDGIDHMIYAGAAIDPRFGKFQLHSLRYEQLRAMCDCARTAFQLQKSYGTGIQVTHLVLVQDATVDIYHDETTERLFDVRGSRDTRYEIVKKRIDKAVDERTQTRITQPGMLTLVYCTDAEWTEYQQYLRYLCREGWLEDQVERGTVQPLQGVTGLRYARVKVRPGEGDAVAA